MKLLTAKTRIAIGLACMMVTVLCTAMMLGMVPERRSAVMDGRANMCETIALIGSDCISRGEQRRLEYLLQATVERNEEVLSAGVRRSDGTLVMSVGDHETSWLQTSSERSTDSQVRVPIRAGEQKWGTVEIQFEQLRKPGWFGHWDRPWLRLTLFVTAGSYLLFVVYLKKMLAHLDPSQTVPRRVRSALDSLAEGLLVIDKDQRIVLANQSFANWVGRDPDKLIGVQAAKLDWVKNPRGEPIREYPWVEAIRLESPQAGVMLGMKRPGGSTRFMITNASPVLGHDGKYRGVLISFDDVTQLEKTKKDLSVAKQAAEDANQAKSEFLARMSHEIRTPMNAILGYTDVLRRGFDESVENRQEYLNTIHGSGEHLLALINDILDLSKVESGQMELELERCSPHQLIQQVITLLRAKADDKGIALEFKADSLLPETILADSVRLRQAIVNLTGNAIKFTEEGGVTLVARLDSSGKQQTPLLAIDVIDSGIGIPKAAQDKIFEPFAQADTSVTRRFGGTGLGLAISKQLAEAMGGGITINSEPGQGSTFTVTIDPGPLDGVRLIDATEALAAETKSKSGGQSIRHLPAARILVADDGESNRKLIELVVGRAGAEVVSVEDGQQAVDLALAEHFDIILMDMQMPVMDGYTAASTLRQARYEQPIIALTAHAMRGDEEKCRAAGCSGFLTKPIKIDTLLAKLHSVLTELGHETASVNTDDAPQPTETNLTLIDSCHEQTDQQTDQQVDQLLVDVVEMQGEVHNASPTPDSQPGDENITPHSEPFVRDPQVGPLLCTHPLDDPEFLEIAQQFVPRLHEQLAAMRQAAAQADHDELARLAHWLKGTGATAGFDALSAPAHGLELAAKALDAGHYAELIARLENLASRIEIVPPADASTAAAASGGGHVTAAYAAIEPATTPLVSSLPADDAEFREIVVEFVDRLAIKLEAMTEAVRSGDYEELARLAHWLKGSGGTAGFNAFTEPAKTLQHCAQLRDDTGCAATVRQIQATAERIAVSTVENTG